MSEHDSKPKPPSGRLLWIGSAFAIVISAMAVASYRSDAELHAAPGSPLYGRAVHEAIQGLAGVGKRAGAGQPGGARPPLPAGLNPDEHYWCDDCKTYHKRQPAEAIGPDGVPASIARPAAPGARPPNPAAQPPTPAAARPPLPQGVSADEVYWCADCRAYHKRGGHAAPANGADGVPQAAAKPPLPAGVSADEVYWCEKCQSYHRKDSKPLPTPAEAPPAPAVKPE